MYVAKLPSTVSFSLRWMSEWMVVFFNGLFGWGQRERDTHRRAYMFVRHTIHIRWAVLILEEKCSDELMYLHEVDVPTTFQFQGHGTVRNAWTCEIFVQLRGTSWFARNRYILAMLPWLPAEFDPGVHLIWANYGSQLCLHWLVNVLPFKTSKNWVDMYSQCVLCISFFMCVCACAFGYSCGESSQHASLVPGRTNTAMILACMVGFVVLKSRCRAWKPWPWVTWSESIWELDDAAMPLCIYIYIIIEVTQGVKRSLHVTANSQPS